MNRVDDIQKLYYDARNAVDALAQASGDQYAILKKLEGLKALVDDHVDIAKRCLYRRAA